ncbi:hypothetical protein ACFLQK_02020 [bacterium]
MNDINDKDLNCSGAKALSEIVKVLIIEERDLLREKIAGILSREKNITAVIQVSSYSALKASFEEISPNLILGDFMECEKFCKETGVSIDELCPGANILLYTDEYERLLKNKVEHLGDQRVVNVRRIQQEVKTFLQDTKQIKYSTHEIDPNAVKLSGKK